MSESKDPGLGSKYRRPVERLILPNGEYNIIRKGGLRGIKDIYKYLIGINWFVFFCWTILAYIFLNVSFALFYYFVCMDQITGHEAFKIDFFNAFYFSIQTFTTVGYGHQAPVGQIAGFMAMIEAFWGLMYFALITGLLYGRFSKPSAKIGFSKNALITPYKDGTAVMFKMVNQRNSVLMKTKVKVFLSIDTGEGSDSFNKRYHELKLEINSIEFFPLTWTIVHPMNENSPIKDLDSKELIRRNAELLVLIETFDETFSQSILEKHSYACNQWREGYKFAKNFHSTEDGKLVLRIDQLDELIPIQP